MSFAEQQRALFDLLFESDLRTQFSQQSTAALSAYQLSPEEQQDFTTIRTDALQLDAAMRITSILNHFSQHFPLSFSLVSSLAQGIRLIEQGINSALMRLPAYARATVFIQQLQQRIDEHHFSTQQEYEVFSQVIGVETQMEQQRCALKKQLLQQQQGPEKIHHGAHEQWLTKPLTLAPFVSSTAISQPYMQLKKRLCPAHAQPLWQHLKQHPLPAFMREEALVVDEPRLFISKAVSSHEQGCDPVVDFITVELAAGFTPIFKHINGQHSGEFLLQQLQQAGANAALMVKVEAGFKQLLETGMLTSATP